MVNYIYFVLLITEKDVLEIVVGATIVSNHGYYKIIDPLWSMLQSTYRPSTSYKGYPNVQHI